MSVAVPRIEKAVVVHKIFIARVVRDINIDEVELTRVGGCQMPQGIVVVTLDDQVFPRPLSAGVLTNKLEPDKISVQRLVWVDALTLPVQPIPCLHVAPFENFDELFFGQGGVVDTAQAFLGSLV